MIAALRSPGEWLSPVLVKEMRQGLKSKAFVGVFLAQHLVLVFGFGIPMVTEDASEVAEVTGVFFWLTAIVGLVVLTPLSGMNAISQEKREHTLELVLLTRLTAWRVIFGKWSSLVAQTALLASGLLPYLVVRYYLGGVNLVLEALALVALVIGSGVLSSVSVVASTYSFVLARLFVLGLQGSLGLMAIGLVASLARPGSSPLSGSSSASAGEILSWLFVVFAVLGAVVFFLLQVAATRIAPPAENHAATKRLTGLVLILLPALPIGPDYREGLVAVLFPILGLMALDACAEPLAPAPTTYLPWARMKGVLRPLALLAYPGWPSGLVVAAVFSLALAGWQMLVGRHDIMDAVVLALAAYATVAAPVGLARIVRRHTPLFVWAAAFHVLTIGGALILGGIAEVLDLPGGRDLYLGLFPFTATVSVAARELSGDAIPVAGLASAAWLGLSAIIIALRGAPALRFLAEMEARARAMAASGKAGPRP